MTVVSGPKICDTTRLVPANSQREQPRIVWRIKQLAILGPKIPSLIEGGSQKTRRS